MRSSSKMRPAVLLSAKICFLFLCLALVRCVAAQTWIVLSPVGSPPVTVPRPAFYDAANNRMTVFFPGNPIIGGLGNQVWVLDNANGLGGTPTWIKLQWPANHRGSRGSVICSVTVPMCQDKPLRAVTFMVRTVFCIQQR